MGRTSLKEPRQKEIVKAFYKLSKKEGLENASIAKVAELMGVSPGLIMHYFKTREHLLYALVEFILDKYLIIFKVPEQADGNCRNQLVTVIDNLFSNKWNALFDDGVSYSCYALVFRDKTIKSKYKDVLDQLRNTLEGLIVQCVAEKRITCANPAAIADMIFVLVDGAYYYLSLTSSKEEYAKRLQLYKRYALDLLHL
ncbi:TetR family transcriptional regulator [Flavihumibacter petaseus]|uniref:Biofilm operon icaADBC HTH-type negative transcriptional regulator IcaR n=1 Tax=Flavihumibacter petaseus NBRC 106054 TaxID=1220578 RepID=A0A0E9MY98_9BACT|nr:TetR family transcriptional regulator [Flavihumibacter petaseus]GAO42707.1 putative TetR family transcriptional regulator [Flavihumibacter petaseus NBRC 106054]